MERAEELRTVIKKEVQGKLISLKLDGVTNNNRSFLGVNLQLVNDGKIKLRTLAVKEITVRHTAENLKNMIIEILDKFDITIQQTYSSTTDNAKNIVKSISLLQDEIYNENNSKDKTDSGESTEGNDSESTESTDDIISTYLEHVLEETCQEFCIGKKN